MQFNLDGETINYEGDPQTSLLDFLRLERGNTTAKDGCSGQGSCGCCMIVQDGRAVLSCLLPMEKVKNTAITTTEGLSPRFQANAAAAFITEGGIQCGFCIPGFVMSAKALIDSNPEPDEDQIRKAINRNLCRCTGYQKIVGSIACLAQAEREQREIELPHCDGKVGRRLVKYDAADTVLGRRAYVADMSLPGMLHGALVLSAHPRAKVLSIDTAAAAHQAVRVFTAADVPGKRSVGLIVPDWPVFVAIGEETRYIGDVIALVVAETEAKAREAAKLVEVAYEVLEPVTDPFAALTSDSHAVHAKGNLLAVSEVKRGGDIDQALAQSAFVARGTYVTQRIEHAFMEPECCLVLPEGDGLRVYSQSQGVYEDRRQLAEILALPIEKIAVEQIQNGGAFGGKEDLSVQGHAALAAYLLGRPVRVALNRAESIMIHPKRHPLTMDYALGCDASGKLTAIKADIVGDTGAYASVGMKVLERAVGHATGAYTVPVAHIVGRTVYTNNVPCGAMRGFGANQATFAMECCVDELCRMGGFDRWQFRYDNALVDGARTSTGQRLEGGTGVKACLEAVRETFQNARYAGLACGIKNTGIGNGMPDGGKCRIDIVAPDRVIVHHGWTEMGQGAHTMAVQVLCQETGLSPDIVEVKVDTTAETHCGMTTASRGTSLIGNSILDACKRLVPDLQAHGLEALVGRQYRGEWVCDWTTKPGKDSGEPVTHYSYSYAAQVVILDDQGKIEKVVAAHDAGKVINPTLFEGQIEGSLHMGLGYALTEDLPMTDGFLHSTLLSKCGVLRARQTPPMEVIAVEVPDPKGPYGAKGVGEIGLVPTAGAVANALTAFDGKRRYRLPLKEKVLPG